MWSSEEASMTFQTRNTLYTLIDTGDGAWLIQGHPKYCPTPIRVTLIKPITVGETVVWFYASELPVGVWENPIRTTPVVEVNL